MPRSLSGKREEQRRTKILNIKLCYIKMCIVKDTIIVYDVVAKEQSN